jgi:hypothetical protein
MKASNDAHRTSVICDERENRRAIKVAPVAAVRAKTHQCVSGVVSTETENGEDMPNGCTARPRVAPDPIITLLAADMSSVE